MAFPSVEEGWLVQRVVWCVADRAWSSLNLPIELRSDPLPPSLIFFSLFFRALFFPPHPFDLPDPSIFFSLTLLITLAPSLPSPRSIHFPPLVCFTHRPWKRTVTSRCPFDRFIETATHSASHLHKLFFIVLDDYPSRVNKRTNRDQHLTFCQVNDYSCAKGL